MPTISGTAQQGQTLTASNGSWTNTPSSYAYQWQDCSSSCVNVSGATSSSYALRSSDVGDTMDVVVTATNDGGIRLGDVEQDADREAAASGEYLVADDQRHGAAGER